jgi:hypothetical protein
MDFIYRGGQIDYWSIEERFPDWWGAEAKLQEASLQVLIGKQYGLLLRKGVFR